MNLCKLTDLIEEMPGYHEIINNLKVKNKSTPQALILDAAKPYLIAALYQKFKIPMLIVTAQPENAKKLFEQIALWCNPKDMDIFPDPDNLPYQRTIPDFSIEQERLQVLYSLTDTGKPKSNPLIIASAPALIQKSISKTDFISACQTLETGLEIDPMLLMSRGESMGYRVENMVEAPGTMSRRGGIIDIFPPTSNLPVRLEFFGNTIESIRQFDSGTQRSQKVIQKITICPATEILPWKDKSSWKKTLDGLDLTKCTKETREQFEQELTMIKEGQRPPAISFYSPLFISGNLLDFLPSDSLIILDECSQIKDEVNYLDNHATELRKQKIQSGELPENFPIPYFKWDEIESRLNNLTKLDLLSWVSSESKELIKLDFISAPIYTGQLSTLMQKTGQFIAQNKRVILVSNQASRLSELLEESNIYVQPTVDIIANPQPGSLTLIQGSLAEGWVTDNTYLLTDKEIFGFVKERHLLKKKAVKHYKLLVDIKPGDYVVHIEHGIGQFMGIQNMSTDNTQKEYLILTYAAGDKLYVPTDQLDRIGRYIGSSEEAPTLSRLGTQEWNRTKQKVKEDVEEIAQDLLQLYAAREVVPGHAFAPDTVWQRELEASFPYVETADQIKVQEEVKEDMSRAKPMDRLVVGDVGYGKTEIAIRAAFKAVMDNKQVAVLVPTTILAEQHYQTFKQRMGTFPVKIEVLSRFRTPKEQKSTIEKLANGNLDIVIGTHRLLQKDVTFKDLGLLVIDEEQRFGVGHKEFLKKLRQQVDVLTLTATPIPRTLHMSLTGVRDMSLIETPPENRLPIKTYIAEYNNQIVRESILRELERNGQVFFVHNRVQGIASIAQNIQKLVPEAQIDIAHGQMPEEQLEKIMLKFQKGETNVLVCTTIIESGLDLPNVNTLIVNRADRFGLTQLYQLRGRIGRGSNIAYAYFLYDKENRLTHSASKRLQTIFEATDLGAGFNIAMKDLEIRGAGNLLGTKQSGNISAVGFSLYTQLLAQAVEDQKARRSGFKKEVKTIRRPDTSIDLPLKSFIPEDYITDVDMRLSIYQQLSTISSPEQVEDLRKELNDRFGPMPKESENLLFSVKLKTMGSKTGIESISTNDNIVTIRLFACLNVNRQRMIPFYRYGIKIGITQVIINLKRLGTEWQSILEQIVESIL